MPTVRRKEPPVPMPWTQTDATVHDCVCLERLHIFVFRVLTTAQTANVNVNTTDATTGATALCRWLVSYKVLSLSVGNWRGPRWSVHDGHLFATRYFHVDAHRLAHRPPRPQALPSPTGLCAGAPAGRSADSVRTTQLLGTSAGRLRCDAAQAGPSQACTRSSGCSLAAGMLVVLRAGVPALPQAVGEDGERAAGQ